MPPMMNNTDNPTHGFRAHDATVLPMTSKKREGRLASRPAIYTCAIVAAIFLAYAYHLRTYTVFACQADGYSTDRYIAYCNGGGYGDYEHGAFWFDLEPAAQDFAKNAD